MVEFITNIIRVMCRDFAIKHADSLRYAWFLANVAGMILLVEFVICAGLTALACPPFTPWGAALAILLNIPAMSLMRIQVRRMRQDMNI